MTDKKLNPAVPSTPAALQQAKAKAEASVKLAAVKPNARQHLRTLFAKVGEAHTAEEVFGSFHAVTIKTHLTDMKNPKYAGKAGVMSVVKMADGTYKRVA